MVHERNKVAGAVSDETLPSPQEAEDITGPPSPPLPTASPMVCVRCNGLLVEDRFVDIAQSDLLWIDAWRCVNCGDVVDAVIGHHRSLC